MHDLCLRVRFLSRWSDIIWSMAGQASWDEQPPCHKVSLLISEPMPIDSFNPNLLQAGR